jgi:hypothetical protein
MRDLTRAIFTLVLAATTALAFAPAVLGVATCNGVFGVTLFFEVSYGEPQQTFCGGAGRITEYSYVGNGINDKTSSFKIFNKPRAAAFVRFYEHGKFGGQSFTRS